MSGFFSKLLNTDDFPARWHCGIWTPFEGWLHIVSDLLIFVAYAAIPMSLLLLIRKQKDFTFPVIAWLFVAFILACGITHAVEATIFYWPVYRLSGVLKAITAVVSLVTAFALIRAMPQALALPSLQRSKIALEAALSREQSLREELARSTSDLEKRSSQVAIRERRMREAVGAAKACALSWELESGKILWQFGFVEAMRSARLNWNFDLTTWDDLIGPEQARELLELSRRSYDEGNVFHKRFALKGHEGVWDLRITATPEPYVKDQAPLYLGMFGLVPALESGSARPQA